MRHSARSTGLTPHTTLIIAIAAAALGAILLAAVLYYCLCRPSPIPVPLPPKQQLARHREQHTHQSAPDSRPATWFDSSFLSAPPQSFAASNSSLLPDSRTGSPFYRPSLNPSDSPSDDIVDLANSSPMLPALPLPNLSFRDTPSSSSLATAASASIETYTPTPISTSDSSFSHNSRHTQSRSASASSRPHRRPRPLSVGSTASSALSRSSRNTIRGMPHGPHSQIQIVLPAPLAFTDRMSLHESPSRLSVVDQWAPPTVRTEGPRVQSQRRSLSSSEPRAHPPINAPRPQRVSASFSPSSSYPATPYRPLPPPVPQIPEQWLPPLGDPLMGIPEDSGRGRSRDIAVSAVPSERPPRPADRPPPPEGASAGQRKLQKRPRSASQGRRL
ncbi:hypothetical protein B0H10DRAFT_1995868 [Mycena sp. CBHHK59/15]|nr:hypothetical protein B0H10DRAFT_1995868 [Mycena sp. CBHHK59/15]